MEYSPKTTLKRDENETHYMWSMRQSVADGIKIYPVARNAYWYKLEIDYNGWLWTHYEEAKAKPRYKKDKHWDIETFKLYQLIQILEKMPKGKNILEEAAAIIFDRDADKALEYGDFHDAMKRAAKMFTLMSGKPMTTRDFYLAMMSLKLTRLQHSDKHDTYLDLIAYIASASTLKNEPLIPKDFE